MSKIHNHDHKHSDNGSLASLIKEELICHLPYGIVSIAVGLTFLSFFSMFNIVSVDPKLVKKAAKILFHNFHFMHIVFAVTGTIITFSRFSKNVFQNIVVGTLSPALFCILSDAVLPYVGARLLGVSVHFHICFLTNPMRVLPFLIIGAINGIVMSYHGQSKQWIYSVSSHAAHIFISSLASVFYLVSHGFFDWHKQLGSVYLLLIVAVVIPCTFSDLIVPMVLAKKGFKHNEKH